MIKRLMEAGNGQVKTPEVHVSFEDDYLGDGITELRGVLLSMGVYKMDEDSSKTVVSMRVVLTSLELSPEKLKELADKVMTQLQRALEF